MSELSPSGGSEGYEVRDDEERSPFMNPVTLLPNSILSLSAEAADRLLALGDGDAALVYLHLLRRGSTAGLNWPQARLNSALDQLHRLRLAPEAAPAVQPAVPELLPPEYTMQDIADSLSDPSSDFPSVCTEVERRLGKKLSTADLKSLYTLYDHLALPAEVILLLVGWCIEVTRQKQGPGRIPLLSQIQKEGFRWARMNIDTLERAEEHLARLTRLRSREGEVLRLLDLPLRPLVEREKSYIAAWDEMGFEDEAIRMAYELTVMKKQAMNWAYMNAILRRWHEQGLHTAAQIRVIMTFCFSLISYAVAMRKKRDINEQEGETDAG